MSFLKYIVAILVVGMLLGASEVNVYFGRVRDTQGDKMILLLKGGGEKSIRLNKDTIAFSTGRQVPYTRIKNNSDVQAAVNSDGLCLQIVVEEAPK